MRMVRVKNLRSFESYAYHIYEDNFDPVQPEMLSILGEAQVELLSNITP